MFVKLYVDGVGSKAPDAASAAAYAEALRHPVSAGPPTQSYTDSMNNSYCTSYMCAPIGGHVYSF